MSERIGAVITGGDFQALGVVRTLGRKGIPIIVLDSEHCICRYSRFKKKYLRFPAPTEEELYVDSLVTMAKTEGIDKWVIFPNSDEAVYVLSRNKHILENFYRLTVPSWEVVEKVYAKKNTYQLAERHGIAIPKTYYPDSMGALSELNLKYPVVIKPSIRPNFYNKVKIKAFRADDRDELINIYRRVSTIIDPSEILLQEFIPGGPSNLYSFCSFFKDGKVAASVMARRSRQHPMDFGHATTFAELVEIPEMQTIAEQFLRLIDFYGISEVEFMRDPRSGVYKLLEVNPRVWGWHTLAIAAGVDLPHMLYQDMIGEELQIPIPVKEMKWCRLITDVPTVFCEIIKGNIKVSEYVKSMKGKKEFAVLSFDDPFPFLVELGMIPYLWWKRGF